jgi:Flp pilus assembly protein TadD
MFNRQITLKPDDTQARVNLAYILNESGDAPKAIEVLTKAAEDIPSFKKQSEEFIGSIVGQIAPTAKGSEKAIPKTVSINGQEVPVNVPVQ